MVLPDEYRKNASVNKKVIGNMKNELGKGSMSEFIAIALKMYAHKQIQVDGTLSEDKKAKGTSKIVTKKTLGFDQYKKCLFDNEIVRCTQYRIKSTPSSVDTLRVNKIALNNCDNKRLRSFNNITTFRYGTSVKVFTFKLCSEELQIKHALASYIDNQK